MKQLSSPYTHSSILCLVMLGLGLWKHLLFPAVRYGNRGNYKVTGK